MRRINFDEIYVFLKVSQAGTFTSAASQLNMPNSTVSAKVASLEKRLGVALLQRTTRRVNLTEIGHIYYERCLDSLVGIVKAEADIKSYQLQPQGTLRVGAPSFLGDILLPKVILDCAKKYPKIHLEILRSDDANFMDQEIDIALAVGPLTDSALISKQLGILPIAAFASPSYLQANEVPKHPRELEKHKRIQHKRFGADSWTFVKGETQFSLKSAPQLMMDDIHLAQAVAILGGGIALLPSKTSHDQSTRDKLVRILPDWQLRDLRIQFIYPQQKFPLPNFKAFLEIAEASIKEQLVGHQAAFTKPAILSSAGLASGMMPTKTGYT